MQAPSISQSPQAAGWVDGMAQYTGGALTPPVQMPNLTHGHGGGGCLTSVGTAGQERICEQLIQLVP